MILTDTNPRPERPYIFLFALLKSSILYIKFDKKLDENVLMMQEKIGGNFFKDKISNESMISFMISSGNDFTFNKNGKFVRI